MAPKVTVDRVSEFTALNECSRCFREEMLNKLRDKVLQGRKGWDQYENKEKMIDKMIRKAILPNLTQKDLIDIAVYCMFIWNLLNDDFQTQESIRWK